jgi:hypothetical protein
LLTGSIATRRVFRKPAEALRPSTKLLLSPSGYFMPHPPQTAAVSGMQL